MSPHKPSRSVRVMTWLAVGLSAVLLVWGIAQYGWSTEFNQRFWSDIFSRASGPMTFRFYLQPTMAFIISRQPIVPPVDQYLGSFLPLRALLPEHLAGTIDPWWRSESRAMPGRPEHGALTVC